MNALVLAIDRLHNGYVGAYGNTWLETPAIDLLAVEGFVFDQFLIDSPHLPPIYRAYWQGRHALCPADSHKGRPALPELIAAGGVHTALLTDEVAIARHPLARSFAELVELEAPAATALAEDVAGTHQARCFARIIEWIESASEPFLLWCHLTAMDGPWDAPIELRLRWAEENDPDPPYSVATPCRWLEKDYDPDELLGFTQCYAGQVMLLDTCLGALWEFLQSSPAGRDTLVALVSTRGFPLGEHLRVGECDESLYGELVHVPLIFRFPDLTGAAARSGALVHPADVWATLLDWWDVRQIPKSPGAASLLPLVREEVRTVRDRLCLTDGAQQRAVRTPAWYLRDSGTAELFAKPDDRWEINDVADRCRRVVQPLRAAMSEYAAALESGELEGLTPLDDVLVNGLE